LSLQRALLTIVAMDIRGDIQTGKQNRARRALLRAAEHGDAATVKELLRSDWGDELGEALVRACSRHHKLAFTPGRLQVVKLLLQADAEPEGQIEGWPHTAPPRRAAQRRPARRADAPGSPLKNARAGNRLGTASPSNARIAEVFCDPGGRTCGEPAFSTG
jgi:hypothetical protein